MGRFQLGSQVLSLTLLLRIKVDAALIWEKLGPESRDVI